MLTISRKLALRLFLGAVVTICLIASTALHSVSANTLSCENINVDGVFTGNVFCISTGSSAGDYAFYYNVNTGSYSVYNQ